MIRLWCLLVFGMLTAETGDCYEKHWSTPWHYVCDVLFYAIPGLRIPVYDAIVFFVLIVGRMRPGATRGRTKPVESAMWLAVGTLLAWAFYGALRGGSVINMRLQLHLPVMVVVAGFAQIYILRRPEDFRAVGKAIVYAALFRFGMMFTFYITVLRSLTVHLETITDHGDSILFVSCIVIVAANALHEQRRATTMKAALVSMLMLWCIQINNRRLAWVGLVGSMLVGYFLLRTGPIRRRINRYILLATPIVLLYVAIGWSRPTGIFKPIASLQSVNDVANPSTQSRILEDIGLIVTLQGNPLVGTGFGHEYTEVSTTYSVHSIMNLFPQYRYMPHNSVLGLLAFTGLLGFAGLWMVFPTTAYFGARSYVYAQTPLLRSIAMVTVCEVIIHVNQLWGDIGTGAHQALVLISGAMAAASRLPVLTGAWPPPKRAPVRTEAAARVA